MSAVYKRKPTPLQRIASLEQRLAEQVGYSNRLCALAHHFNERCTALEMAIVRLTATAQTADAKTKSAD
jgi:hypothetical protein